MTLSRLTTFALTAAALTLSACGGDTKTPAPQTDNFLTSLKADYPVAFAKIANDAETGTAVWVHTTNYKLPGQSPISSNGLVVLDGEDVVLVDGEVGKPVTKMVVTHHHADKVSGVDAAERAGVQVYTHPDTPALAARSGFPVPNTTVAALKEPKSRAKIGGLGGCAIRGAETTTLGNIEDANLTAWPETLRFIKAVYKDAKIVVPGHGKGGDMSLPDHTLKLLAAKINAGGGAEKPKKTAEEVEDLK